MSENERCANCKHCKVLYVPPCHPEVIKAVGGGKNAFACDALGYEGQVMYLKDNEGMCEMFTDKIHPLPFEDESEET